MKERIQFHFFVCLAIAVVVTVISIFHPDTRLGLFGNIALLIALTVFTTIGVVIGDVLRRFTMPDAMLTSGMADTFYKKIFWMIGPQTIGWFIGMVATNGFMRNVLGYSV